MSAQAIPHSRIGYVGGGNVAGVLGISPFRTPLDEYLLISGEREDVVTPEKAEFFEDRRDLEPWAAKKFTRKTGLAIVRTNHRFDDASFPWAKAEVDFEVEDGGNGDHRRISKAAECVRRPSQANHAAGKQSQESDEVVADLFRDEQQQRAKEDERAQCGGAHALPERQRMTRSTVPP